MRATGSSPFSPDFGRPPFFYGRKRYVDVVREALRPGIRPNRSILIEGVRGTGKTALLCHLADVAATKGWEAIYVTSEGAANELIHDLSRSGGLRRLQGASVSVGGVGASIALDRPSKGWTPSVRQVLLDHLQNSGKGMLILVDELQKLRQADAQAICDALNAARAEKLDAALVMAGLPGSFRRLRSFPSCTYMARSTRMWLTLLNVDETATAINGSFAQVPEIDMPTALREEMATFSMGHPYLIQLVGYGIWRRAQAAAANTQARKQNPLFTVTPKVLTEAEEYAYAGYSAKVLDLLIGRLGVGTKRYLRAIAQTMDNEGVMRSGASVAAALGKPQASISSYRTRLMDAGILSSPGRGKLCFTVPYIPRYLEEGDAFWEDEPPAGEHFFAIR